MAEFPAPEGTELERARARRRLRRCGSSLPAAGEQPAVLYLHGGGFAVGSARSNQDLLARLSHGAGVAVIGIDYPLLPDAPLPGGARGDRSPRTGSWPRETGGPLGPRRQLGRRRARSRRRDRAFATPDEADARRASCLSPWFDMTVSAPSLEETSDGDWLGRETLVLAAETYLDGREPTDPLASPLHADLSGLPPMLIQVGGSEILLDDCQPPRRRRAARRHPGRARRLARHVPQLPAVRLAARAKPRPR